MVSQRCEECCGKAVPPILGKDEEAEYFYYFVWRG
jgi:hypothetical protein